MSGPAIVKTLLAKYREIPAVGLDFSFPVSWQMDQDFCQTVTDELRLHGAKWECRKALPTLHHQVPAKSGVYMFVYRSTLRLDTANDDSFNPTWVLYVGRAGYSNNNSTLKNRYKSEYSKYVGGNPEILWNNEPITCRADFLKRYLSIYPLQYWYCIIPDRDKIKLIEDRLIKLLSPPLNRNSRPRLMILPPQPAFRTPS